MKTAFKYFSGILLFLLLFTCEKEVTNPFDPDCPKEIWTPSNFQAVQADNKLDLTWKQDNGNISGFKIERKVGAEDWSNIASPGKTASSWSDTDLKGGELHQYRLCAYAGDNNSNTVTAQATPVFTASLTTAALSELTCSSVILGGNISNTGGATITERGIVYAITANPATSDTKVAISSDQDSFSREITGLEEKTTYYVRAYAINSAGTSYGNQVSFETPACAAVATVITSTPANISCTSATLGGNVTDDGGAAITERGIVYSKTENPAISDNKKEMENGTGSFSHEITGLEEETTYYARAYAINSAGTSYGNQVSFETPACAVPLTVTTSSPAELACNSATLGGSVTDDSGATITERGIVYAKSANPSTSDTKIVIENGQGSFAQEVTGLEEKTTYYVRAYATNKAGTYYGNQVSFNTPACAVEASVTTSTPTNISCTSAIFGGNVTDEGGANVIEKGIVYSKTDNPTTSQNKIDIGKGTGSFNQEITGLEEETTYYIRAYAINSAGTSYGNQVSFTTPACAVVPTVTTRSVTDITPNSASMGGNVTFDGNAKVTECGVVYSISEDPTISDNKVPIGSGTGAFAFGKIVTGLTENTTYYVRAYAINSQGTAYGNQVTFKTKEELTGTFTDERDGKTYKWVKIGEQIWMAENLAYQGTPYFEEENNSEIYGNLYSAGNFQWTCPEGWHVPSDNEWKQLEMAIGMNSTETNSSGWRGTNEGQKLKSISGWDNNGNGTDDYGFTALPGGGFDKMREFYGLGTECTWWTATVAYDGDYTYYYKRSLSSDYNKILRSDATEYYGFSVRCIKD